MRENRLVQIGAKVPAELATALAELANAGDRSVSREIRRAVREHVDRSGGSSSSPHRPTNPAERVGEPLARADGPRRSSRGEEVEC
jgi:hypothetical protein